MCRHLCYFSGSSTVRKMAMHTHTSTTASGRAVLCQGEMAQTCGTHFSRAPTAANTATAPFCTGLSGT